jgi:16S rRNA (guanine527-N7)-methyltransferase
VSELLKRATGELGFQLTDGQLRLFDRYAEVLLSKGRLMGVTGIATTERIERRHFIESLAIARALLDGGVLRDEPLQVIDVGTGGGFPGLPIEIVLPRLRLTLLDDRQRTTAFLDDVLKTLAIEDVEVVSARAEDAGRNADYRERFDVALARAVAPLPVLLELTLPFLRVGGRLAALKGSSASRETAESNQALAELSGEVLSAEVLAVPGAVHRQRLLVIEKAKATPARYPRRAGTPKKRPL